MGVEGGDPRIGFVLGISRAHRVLPWEVLGGWGRWGQPQLGLALGAPRTHRGFSERHWSFSCRREVGGGRSGGWYACHTPARTRGCAVTHRLARGVTARCPCGAGGSASLRATRSHARARARCRVHAHLAVPPLRSQRPSCYRTRAAPGGGTGHAQTRAPLLPRAPALRRSAIRAWRGGARILMSARPHCARPWPGPAPGPASRGAAAARG